MSPMGHRELVTIGTGASKMEGLLALPAAPSGIVLFAHGSGSSRHSPRNNYVLASMLHLPWPVGSEDKTGKRLSGATPQLAALPMRRH